MIPHRTNDDLEIVQAASDLVQAVWPGYRGDIAEALRTIAELERLGSRSPGVQQVYAEIRVDLERRVPR